MNNNNISGDFRSKKALVTGGYGFIGTHLVRALRELGAETCVVSNVPATGNIADRESIGDLKDPAFTENAVKTFSPDMVFHLAADKTRTSRLDDFQPMLENNLFGSLHLFRSVIAMNKYVPTVVLGTAEEYGNIASPFHESQKESPVSSYSFSKLCVTALCDVLGHNLKAPFTVIRPSIAYGPGQGTEMFLPALIRSLLDNKPFEMTAGDQKRDFIYITDLVEAVLLSAVRQNAWGQVINVGSGKQITIRKAALLAGKLTGKTGLIRLGKIPYRVSEMMDYGVSTGKAKSLLGWRPSTMLEQGMLNMIAFEAGKDHA
jgi:nucleoside-diphosphate-sugar epimerase